MPEESADHTNDNQPEWIGNLSEDLRTPENLPTLSKFKLNEGEQGIVVPPTVIKSYIEAQKKIAQKGILLPGENATEEDKNAFHKAIGRPDKPEDYGLVKPEKLPDGVNFNEQRTKNFSELFFRLGITSQQAKAIFDAYNQDIIGETETQQKAVKDFQEKTVADLKKEYGSSFDKNTQKSDAAAKLFGGREMAELLKSTGLNFHPVMFKAWLKVAERIGEASLVDGFTDTTAPALTRSKLEQMMKDPRYSGKEYDRDPEYIKQVREGFRALEAAGQL